MNLECPKCGYDLRGSGEARCCPECGLLRNICDACGAELATGPDKCPCVACGRTSPLAESALRSALLFPWRRECASGVWLAPLRRASLGSDLLFLVVGLLGATLGLTSTAFGLIGRWHKVAVAPTDACIWSWRADMIVAHWAELLPDRRPYRYSAVSHVYVPGDPRCRLLHPGDRPSKPADAVITTYHQSRQVVLLGLANVFPIWLMMFASPLALVIVARFVPPLGLWLATRPGTRVSFLKNGMRRLQWAVVPGMVCQGIWLAGVSVYDITTPITGFTFLGLGTFGVDILLPVLVAQILAFRGVLLDQGRWVFEPRSRALFHVGVGIAVTVVLMILAGVGVSHLPGLG